MLGWMGVGGQEKPGDFSRPPTDEFNFVAMQPGAQASETGYRFPRAPVSRTISGLLFPVSLKSVGDHISTRSAARKRNPLRTKR